MQQVGAMHKTAAWTAATAGMATAKASSSGVPATMMLPSQQPIAPRKNSIVKITNGFDRQAVSARSICQGLSTSIVCVPKSIRKWHGKTLVHTPLEVDDQVWVPIMRIGFEVCRGKGSPRNPTTCRRLCCKMCLAMLRGHGTCASVSICLGRHLRATPPQKAEARSMRHERQSPKKLTKHQQIKYRCG